jgi:hypothetical protein
MVPPVVVPFVERPGPAVMPVTVPANAEATLRAPYWSIETPLPATTFPKGVEIRFDRGEENGLLGIGSRIDGISITRQAYKRFYPLVSVRVL